MQRDITAKRCHPADKFAKLVFVIVYTRHNERCQFNVAELCRARDEPFYRDMVRLYEFEGNIVSEDFYELVIPNRFIYNLTQNTLSNFFDFCLKEQRLPLENRSNFKRAVDLTWRD